MDKGINSNSCDRTLIAKKLRYGDSWGRDVYSLCFLRNNPSSTLHTQGANSDTQIKAHDPDTLAPKFVV